MALILNRKGNCESLVDYLVQGEFDFKMVCSNYTTRLESEIINLTFSANRQNKRTFAAYSKLKSDLNKVKTPNVNSSEVRYFEHNFNKDAYFQKVINIDLKSAYTTILFNDKMITEKTHDYISNCKKQERLAAVGMLASRKRIFEFKNGNPISFKEEKSIYSGFFFYCVKRTSEIMDELKKICGQNYLFTWVDGIYFLPNEDIVRDCMEYLNNIAFNFHIDILTNFSVVLKMEKPFVTFKKGNGIKKFNLPAVSSEYRKIIMEATMLYNKTNKNEKSKIKNSF